MTTCSTAQIDSTPQRSAVVARWVSISGNANGPAFAYMSPNFIPRSYYAHRDDGGGRLRRRRRRCYAAPMDLVELAPAVYACLQEEKGLGTSNSGLVDCGVGLVVDTFWDLPHTREMIATYARVWQGPAHRVVNTHRNGDHCWGNQLFDGAEIIGHRLCAEQFGLENPAVMQALRGATGSGNPATAAIAAQLADWDFTGIELRPPTTLVDDRLELDLDGVAVHLIWVGPAHTAGDLPRALRAGGGGVQRG